MLFPDDEDAPMVEYAGYGTVVEIRFDQIDGKLRPASQHRAALNQERITDYAESIDQIPPIKVVFDPETNTHWLAAGCHRIEGAKQAGRDRILARVRQGDYWSAYREAAHDNFAHGVPRSGADKKHGIIECYQEAQRQGKTLTQQEIADLCAVTQPYVSRILGERAFITGNKSTLKPSRADIETYCRQHPELSNPQLAADLGCDQSTVGRIRRKLGIARPRGGSPARTKPKPAQPTQPEESAARPVDAPKPEPPPDRKGEASEHEDNSSLAPGPTTQPLPNQSTFPEFDAGKAWSDDEATIRALFYAWPEEERACFAIKLETLAKLLKRECPDLVSEPFVLNLQHQEKRP